MKAIFILIRAIGLLGAGAIVYWLIQWNAYVIKEMPPEAAASGGFDQILYATIVPFGVLAFLLILPYTFLPRPVRQACRLIILLLGAYFLFYRFGAHFLPSPYPYSKPDPLTLATVLHLIFWIAFFLAQLFAIYHIDSNMPQPPSGKGHAPTKAPVV